jgi:anti-sigma regulatory factor (Ser/Thr protein kinase)
MITATISRDTVAGHARWQAEGAVGRGSNAGWPLSGQLPLGALPTAVPCARGYTRAILDEWNLASLTDAAELVVSELVSNSVQATMDAGGWPRYGEDGLPVVHLRLASDRGRVRVEVWDSVPRAPAARHPRLDEEGGRGLALVEALSDRWAWTAVPGWHGKVVWAELRPH